jgi:hypothetical protein
VYDSLFFQATDLDPNIPHTLTWALNPNPKTGGTIAMFDYAIITEYLSQFLKDGYFITYCFT